MIVIQFNWHHQKASMLCTPINNLNRFHHPLIWLCVFQITSCFLILNAQTRNWNYNRKARRKLYPAYAVTNRVKTTNHANDGWRNNKFIHVLTVYAGSESVSRVELRLMSPLCGLILKKDGALLSPMILYVIWLNGSSESASVAWAWYTPRPTYSIEKNMQKSVNERVWVEIENINFGQQVHGCPLNCYTVFCLIRAQGALARSDLIS